MDVHEAIAAAERILPGVSASEGQIDPRWQAIIEVEEFLQSNPEDVWPFIVRWDQHEDDDLRAAIATCLLEHLLECQFERFFPLVEQAVRANRFFADTVTRCWKFGQAENADNATRFDALKREAARLCA
jgi:hypothetical protein